MTRFIIQKKQRIKVPYQSERINRHVELFKTEWFDDDGDRVKLELIEKFPKPDYQVIQQTKEETYQSKIL